MIKLKLRGKHCPVNFTGRTRIEAKPIVGGLFEYELNPDVLTDIFDELCDRILILSRDNRRMEIELTGYKSQSGAKHDNRVQVGKGYGD